MQRDKGYLFDILESAIFALSYVKDKTLDSFLTDTQCQDAVIRRLDSSGFPTCDRFNACILPTLSAVHTASRAKSNTCASFIPAMSSPL